MKHLKQVLRESGVQIILSFLLDVALCFEEKEDDQMKIEQTRKLLFIFVNGGS